MSVKLNKIQVSRTLTNTPHLKEVPQAHIDEYVLTMLGYAIGEATLENLPYEVALSEELLLSGEPESFTYKTSVYVLTEKELTEYTNEVIRRARLDLTMTSALQWSRKLYSC